MQKPKVSIIIPAYNEEENISILLEQINKTRLKENLNCEVVVVDDGSTDKTFDSANRCAKEYNFVKVIKHNKNLGKTDAIISGVNVSDGDLIVLMDADLQYSPDCIPLLIKKLESGFDIVTGWKKGKYEKKLVSYIYNMLSRKLFNLPIHDQNAIKILKKEIFDDIYLRKDWHRYICALASDKGYRIGEIEVPLYPRKYGKSKYSGAGRVIIGLLDLISVKFQISFMKKPLLLFGSVGGILLFLGFVIGIFSIYQRFVLQHGYRPLLYLTILLIVVGLLFFILGFLAESIAYIHEEIRKIKEK